MISCRIQKKNSIHTSIYLKANLGMRLRTVIGWLMFGPPWASKTQRLSAADSRIALVSYKLAGAHRGSCMYRKTDKLTEFFVYVLQE